VEGTPARPPSIHPLLSRTHLAVATVHCPGSPLQPPASLCLLPGSCSGAGALHGGGGPSALAANMALVQLLVPSIMELRPRFRAAVKVRPPLHGSL